MTRTAKALNVVGLVVSLLGVILLFLFGMPFRIAKGGYEFITTETANPKDIATEVLYSRLGWIGLALIIIGTVAQILATLWSPRRQ